MVTGLGQQAGAVDGAPAGDRQRKTVSPGSPAQLLGEALSKGEEAHRFLERGGHRDGTPAHPWGPGRPVVTWAPRRFCSSADGGKGCVCTCTCVSVGSEDSVSLLLPQTRLRT